MIELNTLRLETTGVDSAISVMPPSPPNETRSLVEPLLQSTSYQYGDKDSSVLYTNLIQNQENANPESRVKLEEKRVRAAQVIAQQNQENANPESRVKLEEKRVRAAQVIAEITQEKESDLDRKAQINVYSKNYSEEQAVKRANEFAKKRDKDGLDVKEDKYSSKPIKTYGEAVGGTKKQLIAEEDLLKKMIDGGYKISDYETSDYETKGYKTAEYKSVYD
eukprot:CAMPEP_0171324366 /NCGR_PEP_ID=MMETSP0816-20121228/116141_1 /TAXON_ID=420281 /ORGANISM="Proboscia inermis, Strain CCAP1064/1" /LENGTH=220 /DNA_ID=CAMNT_0011823281 /DNA_START=89 /DNA_END=751 /DNA_ORIENTATION=-